MITRRQQCSRTRWAGTLLTLTLSIVGGAACGQDPNLGLATDGPILVDGATAAFTGNELAQGETDLNGDGDATDRVVHVFDAWTGMTQTLDINASGMILREPLLAIFAPERTNGDLNGDGDQIDVGLQVFNTERQTLRDVGLAVFPTSDPALFDGRRLAIGADERFEGRDLNGDGDTDDSVVHLLDLETDTLTNTGLATEFGIERFDVGFGGRFIGIRVAEGKQGERDLNGDGDLRDSVLHILDTQTGEITNTGLVPDFDGAFQLGAGVALVLVNEIIQGADLNGDGDVRGVVLRQIDLESGQTHGPDLLLQSQPFSFDPDQGIATFLVDEDSNGVDLDGDGQTLGAVVHALFTDTREVVNLGLRGSVAAIAPEGRLVVLHSEGPAGLDQNGDGDATDRVVQIVRIRPIEVIHTGKAFSTMSLLGGPLTLDRMPRDVLTFLVGEAEQGGLDLNGDGDAMDAVLHVTDLRTGATRSTGIDAQLLLATAFGPLVPPSGGHLGVPVAELFQGETDLNGDGDALDVVLHRVDVATGEATNTGVAIPSFQLPVLLEAVRGEGFVAVPTPEGDVDLNQDGDLLDSVVVLVDLATGRLTNTCRAAAQSTNQIKSIGLSGTSGLFVPGTTLPFGIHGAQGGVISPGPGPGDVFAFTVSEAQEGMDLNDDGDLLDNVAHALRLVDNDGDGRFEIASRCQ